LIGAGLAIIGLMGVVVYIDGLFPSLGIANDYTSIGIVIFGVLLIGTIITSISTYFATQRFLNLKTDDLY
jgi:cell division transport system permease protein